ncbi:MAG: hypothetical protein ACREGR_04530 [Minisyncoccia bacterium]
MAFVGEPSGVHVRAAVGEAVLIVHVSCADAVVDELPARSETAPLAIWSVSVPSALGADRLTLNVYGPAPLPESPEAAQMLELPPTVRSEVVGLKPVTDSVKLTEQLRLVALIVPGAGAQVKLATDGGVRSTVHVKLAFPPTLPALSTAWTWNVWLPAAKPE